MFTQNSSRYTKLLGENQREGDVTFQEVRDMPDFQNYPDDSLRHLIETLKVFSRLVVGIFINGQVEEKPQITKIRKSSSRNHLNKAA